MLLSGSQNELQMRKLLSGLNETMINMLIHQICHFIYKVHHQTVYMCVKCTCDKIN